MLPPSAQPITPASISRSLLSFSLPTPKKPSSSTGLTLLASGTIRQEPAIPSTKCHFSAVIVHPEIAKIIFRFLAPSSAFLRLDEKSQRPMDSLWHQHVNKISRTMKCSFVCNDHIYPEIAAGLEAWNDGLSKMRIPPSSTQRPFYRDLTNLGSTSKLLKHLCPSSISHIIMEQFKHQKMACELLAIFNSALLACDSSRVEWALRKANREQLKTLLSEQEWKSYVSTSRMPPLAQAFDRRRCARGETEEHKHTRDALRAICNSLFIAIASFGFPSSMLHCSLFELYDDERSWFAEKMQQQPDVITRRFLREYLLPKDRENQTVLCSIFRNGRPQTLREFYTINRDAFVEILSREKDLFAHISECYVNYLKYYRRSGQEIDIYCAWFVRLGAKIPNLKTLTPLLRKHFLKYTERAVRARHIREAIANARRA